MKLLTIKAVLVMLVALQAQGTRIECNFDMTIFEGIPTYRCFVDEVILTRNSSEIVITGAHLPNKTNVDVGVVDTHSLPSIVTEFFTTFPNLRHLTVSDLIHIQPEAFANAQNLRYIYISNSPLPVLPAYAFEGAPNIHQLTLGQCETTTIDENALVGLTELNTIIIGAKLQELPENTFRSLENLRSVFILGNNIEAIHPALFENNLKLFTAYFTGNKINAVSRSFVEKLVNNNVNQLTFTGNNCGNSDRLLYFIDFIHTELDQCYRNYEEMFTP